MTSAYYDIRELQAEMQRLQRALNFWLPSVPAEGPEEIVDRIAKDACLLVGYEPDGDDPVDAKDAEQIGWITMGHWQPIETAPRDGTPVDLWHKSGGRIPETWWDAEDECWSCIMDDSDFTHWMPMPSPPAVSGDSP